MFVGWQLPSAIALLPQATANTVTAALNAVQAVGEATASDPVSLIGTGGYGMAGLVLWLLLSGKMYPASTVELLKEERTHDRALIVKLYDAVSKAMPAVTRSAETITETAPDALREVRDELREVKRRLGQMGQ